MRARYRLHFIFPILFIACGLPGALVAQGDRPTVDLSVYRHVSSIIWPTKDVDRVVD
jgi:hypothetical protein